MSLVANPHQKLLTRSKAAALLDVKPNTLAVWACKRRYDLPFIKVGRLVRYREDDVLAFLERHRFAENERA